MGHLLPTNLLSSRLAGSRCSSRRSIGFGVFGLFSGFFSGVSHGFFVFYVLS